MSASSVDVTQPSEQELSKLGLQSGANIDNIWLPTEVTAPFQETLPQDVERFVSEGKGSVAVGGESFDVSKGTLLTVKEGPADLTWTPDAGGSLTLLISEYYSPGRMAARQALPVVLGVLGVAAVVVVVSGVVSG